MPKTIIVTGFGPFSGHEKRNASWEAVRLLPDAFRFRNESFELRKYEVPVTYEAADRMVKLIWDTNPILVVHVGVHGLINTVNLEHCSYTSGYCKPDYANRYLSCGKVTLAGEMTKKECNLLQTGLDIERITDELNLEANVTVCCSTEVGNYLCGYIYVKSLDINPERTLFIHVPDVGKPYSSEETKTTIYNVIGKCLEQLSAET